MEWIKRRTFDYALRRARRKKQQRLKKGKLQGTKFLLLHSADATDTIAPLHAFMRSLEQSGKEVRGIHFIPAPEQKHTDDKMLSLSNKDSNWYGKPKSEVLDTLLETSWDILICFDENIPRVFQYIIAMARAEFKVGVVPGGRVDFDLRVDVSPKTSLKTRIDEVQNVLQTVSTVMD